MMAKFSLPDSSSQSNARRNKGLRQLFGLTSSIRPQVGDRVLNKDSRQLGTVEGKSVIQGTVKVPAINLRYDSGLFACFIAENEFIKVGR